MNRRKITEKLDDWRTEAQKSPAWPEFLQWAGDDDVPIYSGNLAWRLARTRWDAFQAGVIVGQGLVAEASGLTK